MTSPVPIVLLVAGAAAAVSTLVHAAGSSRRDALLNPSALEPADAAAHRAVPTGWPIAPDGAPLGASGRTAGADLSSRFGAVARGGWGADAAISTMDSGFESLAPLPAELVGQQDTVTWGGAAASVTGRNVIGPISPGVLSSQYGAVSEPIAGNSTRKLRGIAQPAFGPNTFFGRWCRYDLVKTNSATGGVGARFIFQPGADQDVRVMHDTFVTSINSLWTSEPANISSGFIIARLLWGGQNSTTGIGLPIGPIPDFYTLDPSSCGGFFECQFVPCGIPQFYRRGAPFPGWNGNNPQNDPTQRVPVPVNAWFTIIHETTSAKVLRHVLDLHDGNGEFVIFEASGLLPNRVDRVAFSGAFETENEACYIDNVHIEGVQFTNCLRPQGDLDFDGDIDFTDLNALLSNFGATGSPGFPGDVNNDGVVNFTDLNTLLSNFGATC